jgi:uncharacterized GH25 family protein
MSAVRVARQRPKFRSWARRAVAVLLCAAGASSAHEFWLQPDDYTARPGQIVHLQFGVGMGWHGEVRSIDASRVVRFSWIDAKGERPVSALGIIRTGSAGPAWGVLRSNRAALMLEADAFESYLRDEGLEAVIDARKLRGEFTQHGREVYSRCAKTLLQVGEWKGSADFVSRPVGLTLELVPQNDGSAFSDGEPFHIRLLYQGKPLADALVKAFPKSGGAVIQARTDAHGLAVLPNLSGGIWMLTAVHMVRADPRLDADWESIWSSLTLRVPEASKAIAPNPKRESRAARPL